jgi:hypothetical protein
MRPSRCRFRSSVLPKPPNIVSHDMTVGFSGIHPRRIPQGRAGSARRKAWRSMLRDAPSRSAWYTGAPRAASLDGALAKGRRP